MANKLLVKRSNKEKRAGSKKENNPRFKIPSREEPLNNFPPRIDPPQKEVNAQKIEPRKAFVDTYDLPQSYGTTSITLIARDPFWIYAYWEIAASSIEAARNQFGFDADRASCVLRVYDVSLIDFNGTNANKWFDLEVGPYVNNWYINLWNDNVSYCADLGLRFPDGSFFTLARSNIVTTPRQTQSWRSEQMWMEVKESGPDAPFVIGNIHKVKNESIRQQRKDTGFHKPKKSRKIYLSEEDIRQYYSRLSPLLKDIISSRISRKSAVKRHSDFGSMPIKGKRVTLDEFRISGLSWDQFVKKMLSGSSAELVLLGASENLPGGASEQISSPQPDVRKRKFFFELGAELIVYGRTEPDAEVWYGDKKIPLRQDGTFSLRFALPDTKIPLGFTAISSDKVEKREITTAVERFKTRYNP